MTPLVRALAKAGHAVDLVTPRAFSVLFEENPHLRAQFSIEEIAPGFPASWQRLSGWIKAQKYEALLLPSPKPRPLLWSSFFSGVPRRLALQAGVWGRLTGHQCLSVRRAFMSGRHYSDIQLDLARALERADRRAQARLFFSPGGKRGRPSKDSPPFPGLEGRTDHRNPSGLDGQYLQPPLRRLRRSSPRSSWNELPRASSSPARKRKRHSCRPGRARSSLRAAFSTAWAPSISAPWRR